jgi:hypothetical protein
VVKASFELMVSHDVTATETVEKPSPIMSSVALENHVVTSTSVWPDRSAEISSFHF